MPTGYTADVQSGKITEFSDYALQCARAFGALIEMRDEKMNADIPDKFLPSDYHVKGLAAAKADFEKFNNMTAADAKAARDAAEAQRVTARSRRIEKSEEQRARYEAMLVKAKEWVAPTPDHAKMAEFMVDQLKQSIDFDCKVYNYDATPLPCARDWLAERIADAVEDLGYHEKKYAKDVARAEGRTKWVAELRASLV